jgi:predicted RNase H-like nuclease (RuvC/YqgF family)
MEKQLKRSEYACRQMRKRIKDLESEIEDLETKISEENTVSSLTRKKSNSFDSFCVSLIYLGVATTICYYWESTIFYSFFQNFCNTKNF